MKVILSRKGFDSAYGGYPSPILPSGEMISLPIPSTIDSVRYSQLILQNNSVFQIMKSLHSTIRINNKWVKLKPTTTCHLDPDIYEYNLNRPKTYRPSFGQIGTSQSHLRNNNIRRNDIFLFFGWFRKTVQNNNTLTFDRNDKGKHVIFGYLQIGQIIDLTLTNKHTIPTWAKSHVHWHPFRVIQNGNTLYVARTRLSWDKNLPGAGVFNFSQSLILTKKNCNKSIWQLPSFFRNLDITYHSKKSWLNSNTFKSTSRGQEFIIDGNRDLQLWISNLISKNTLSYISMKLPTTNRVVAK